MQLIEVTNPTTRKEFLEVPRVVYKNDPVWVCPLDSEIEDIFNPKKNNFHSFGEITRWILKDDNGNLIGRVAAFINKKKAYNWPQPTGGIGYFECINDEKAAFTLFNGCKKWLQERGMKAMDGSINFGENDKFWGLLIHGFTHPSYGMNYNPPYYQGFFEKYGFVKQYDQRTRLLDLTQPFTDRFAKIADWVMKKPGYTFEHLEISKFDKYAADIAEIYNNAWENFENFTPITQTTIREMFEQMKPIVDEKLIWFAYINGEPASFIVCIPDVNQIFKHTNGKLNLIGKLKFVYHKWRKSMNRIRIMVMGTKKAYQKHGLESVMIRKLQLMVMPDGHYKEAELSWVGDFNEKMEAIHEATGAKHAKTHATYRFIFPENI
ncbi:GNAT family N-acetyltransferase [Solitalea koreensis]|uniref:N-acetyltransferase domain-containing protein n=1 Tax=Solitalea koreensis TaxID=543615 RepID=A0A521DXS8_9SPHI|nr:GNAT family N-acetyltransferase [Solitalea koreensis]SMO76523.1 hypothetical protein SAMN06265350_10956 [Solitalea koreensis]